MIKYLKNKNVKESSGICRSIKHLGVYWTHNDSGSKPILYAFDELGTDICQLSLSCPAMDWEDIASNLVNNVPTIILADVGDNEMKRGTYSIRVITEPEILSSSNIPFETITFKYPDGLSHNCESICLRSDGVIVLVTKNHPSGGTKVFEIRSYLSGHTETTCTFIRNISTTIGIITSMDISPSGDKYVLLGGGYASLYTIENNFKTPYKRIRLPKMFQPEAICFSQNDLYLLITCEVQKTATIQQTPLYTINI